jgi:hypothetical protein
MDTIHAEVLHQLQNLDIDGLTPLDALNLISELKKKALQA